MKIMDSKIESIDVLNWLKTQYGNELNADLVSVSICQSETDVWLIIKKEEKTEFGILSEEKIINLDFICDLPEDDPEGMDVCVFTPERSLVENAKMYFTDKIMLLNTTPLFDK